MKELGALCHVTIARDDNSENRRILTEMKKDEFVKVWGALLNYLTSKILYFILRGQNFVKQETGVYM